MKKYKEKRTKLYGLIEGILGKHKINKNVKEVIKMVPKEVMDKCSVFGNSIRGFSACDG